jgi:hypothetical protein
MKVRPGPRNNANEDNIRSQDIDAGLRQSLMQPWDEATDSFSDIEPGA